MPDDKCTHCLEDNCQALRQTDRVAGDLTALGQRLTDFQESVQATQNRFGARIGKLEAHAEVQDEQLHQIERRQDEIKKEIEASRKEQRDSIYDLKQDHKDSMTELKKTTKEILDVVTPMQHRLSDLDYLKKDVDDIKVKPAKRWDSIVGQIIGLIVAALIGVVLVRLGLK